MVAHTENVDCVAGSCSVFATHDYCSCVIYVASTSVRVAVVVECSVGTEHYHKYEEEPCERL